MSFVDSLLRRIAHESKRREENNNLGGNGVGSAVLINDVGNNSSRMQEGESATHGEADHTAPRHEDQDDTAISPQRSLDEGHPTSQVLNASQKGRENKPTNINKATQPFDLLHHKKVSQQVFLAPLPRRQMTIPAAIRERKALYEKENAKHVSAEYVYREDELMPLRALTPLRSLPASVASQRRSRKSRGREAAMAKEAPAGELRDQGGEEGVPESLTRADLDDGEVSCAGSSVYASHSSEASLRMPPPLRYVPAAVTVTSAELAAIKRLAAFDEPVRTEAALPVEIPTSGYNLRWLHNPKRYPKPANPLNLLTMRTDYLLHGGCTADRSAKKTGHGEREDENAWALQTGEDSNGDANDVEGNAGKPSSSTKMGKSCVGGGSEHDHYPFIESPRSVLVLVRNGANPMDLQERPPVGFGDSLTNPHAAFKERLRQDELERLREEYCALCEVLPSSTVDSFFSLLNESSKEKLLSSGGPQQVVKPMLEKDDDGIYRVAFHYEVSTAASAVVEKLDRTRANLRNLVESEISLTRERTEALRQQQERSLAAARKHEAQIAAKQQERRIISAIKADTVQQRSVMRHETAELLRLEAEAQFAAKQERLAVNEARIEREKLARMAALRQREEQKELKRFETLRVAEERTEQVMEQRASTVERKNEACAMAKAAKVSELETAKMKRLENEKKALVRKQEIEDHKTAEREIRLHKQLAREEAAQAQVEKLKKEQQTTATIKGHVSLQKLITIDERQLEEERRLEAEREDMLRRRAEASLRQERLMTVLDYRRRERQRLRDELRVQKGLYLARQARIDQFNNLMVADRMLDAAARIEATAKAKEEMTKEARYERDMLLQWRHKTIQETRKDAEERERVATLSVFNMANPSAAVLLREKNARAVGLIPRQRRPQKLPTNAVEMHE